MKSRIVIHFTHLRPYHLARLRSAEDAFAETGTRVHGLALIDSCDPLPADLPILRPTEPPVILSPDDASRPSSSRAIAREVKRALDRIRPSVIAICGYATPDARACLRWCRRHKAKAILMTETREQDGHRVWWKEWIKSRIVRSFDAALCGGPEARAYLKKLGMPADRIAEGYDVVDNEYFATESMRHRNEDNRRWTETDVDIGVKKASSSKIQHSTSKITPYFLASNRLIPRKNVAALIEAYALYLHSKSKIQNSKFRAWNLCLLGDGELKGDLIAQCRRLGLQVQESAPWESSQFNIQHSTSNIVYLPGWRSHAELPRFYAHAGAFVHPAISEPWGLVINEATACGLPVLMSPGTGAAGSLLTVYNIGEFFNLASPNTAANQLNDLTFCSEKTEQAVAAISSRLESQASSSSFGHGIVELLGK